MKKLLIIVLIFSCMAGQGQIRLKEHIVPATLVFLAGICDGVADGLQFHYDGNSQYWQPDISWTNKYKNHDPAQGEKFIGSTSVFVFTTDGWHLMKFGRNLFTAGAITFKISGWSKKRWWVYIVEGASYWIVNRAGFALSYSQF